LRRCPIGQATTARLPIFAPSGKTASFNLCAIIHFWERPGGIYGAYDPQTAADVDDRIEAAGQRPKDFPNSGRPARIEGTRELVVARAPYIAPYQIIGDTVRVLRVIHGARMWPHDIPPE
jgi:toxin ParE1/3/4